MRGPKMRTLCMYGRRNRRAPYRTSGWVAQATAALVLSQSGCAAEPVTTVRPVDFPNLLVECRTQPLVSPGDCEGWAMSFLGDAPDATAPTEHLVLSGKLGPGQRGAQCQAEFVDSFGISVASIPISCHVPSGG